MSRTRLICQQVQRRAVMRSVLGRTLTEEEADESDYQVSAGEDLYDTLRIFRSYRPGGWHPHITLTGVDHLRGGLQKGRGVLLWISNFQASRLVPKMAFAAAGYRLHHLSRPTHGFSQTYFAVQYLNQYWAHIENRFLAERIVLEEDNMTQVIKRLKTLLGENRVVSITDAATARQLVTLPFLAQDRRFATGPANLALRTGADLLPVFCLEKSPRDFEVIVGESLCEPNPVGDLETVIRRYSEVLGRTVFQHPNLWGEWRWMPGNDCAGNTDTWDDDRSGLWGREDQAGHLLSGSAPRGSGTTASR